MKNKINKAFWLVIMITNFMLLSGLVVPSGPVTAGSSNFDLSNFDLESYARANPSLNPTVPSNSLPDGYGLPENLDYLDYIGDTPNDYHKVWEPWLTKAAVHAIAVSDDNEYLAVVGGYLADDEIHIYRWNAEDKSYDKVWDAGDGIIQGDIRAAAFGDTDYNDFLEIIVASSDGHIYVFEQRHIYDPITNTENQFELVWKSPAMAPVWGLTVKDLDKDYRPDIIAGSWDGKVHIFEWLHHGNYPFSGEHWIEYEEVWTSDYLGSQITSLVSGDVNYNGLPDFVVGTRNGTTHIFENAGEVLMINGVPFPLCNDNHYDHIYSTGTAVWNPIKDIAIGNTDDDEYLEIAIVAQGDGVYFLDYNDATESFTFNKLVTPFDSWEEGGAYPLDPYIDRIINESSYGVFYDNGTGFYPPEPLTPLAQYPEVYPYNTGAAQETDGHFSVLDSTYYGNYSVGVYDFGGDQEFTGNANTGGDMYFAFNNLGDGSFPSENFQLAISQDGEYFVNVSSDCYRFVLASAPTVPLKVDLDPVLQEHQWAYARYIKITVSNNAIYYLDSVKAYTVYRPVDTAASVTIAPIAIDYSELYLPVPFSRIVIGTIDGRIIVFGKNGLTAMDYLWDSYKDERYKQDSAIWDIQHIGTVSDYPGWLRKGDDGEETFLGSISNPDFGSLTSATLFDVDLDFWPEWVAGTDNGRIALFDYTNTMSTEFGKGSFEYDDILTSEMFVGINDHGSNILTENHYLSPTFGELVFPYPYQTLVLGILDNRSLSDPAVYEADAHIALCVPKFIGSEFTYTISESEFYLYLEDLETTGLLIRALQQSSCVPEIALTDMDGDGDNDIIMTNGFVHYIENTGGGVSWTYHSGYFEEVNEILGKWRAKKPQAVDFNNDGIIDLMISFDRKDGGTYFENEGTAAEPKWIEKRKLVSNNIPESHFGYNQLTDLQFVEFVHPLTHEAHEYLVAYNASESTLFYFTPIYGHQATFVIGTNPKVARMELSLMSGEDLDDPIYYARNFGYHVLETWNNLNELKDWTLSLTTGDLDGDGNGEIIIGDFDNNIYVFEHMTNNSYKRAWKSQDIVHVEETTDSPYAHEVLEGINGTFFKSVWDHIEYLTAGVDMDGDGLLEFIAVADYTIYLFEHTGQQDTFVFQWEFDMREYSEDITDFFELAPKGITSLTASNDLNGNGYGEIIVGCGAFLFVFESQETDEGFVFEETFNPISSLLLSPLGRYLVPGNPLTYLPGTFPDYHSYQHLSIDTIMVHDFDKNGYYELIYGGKNMTNPDKDMGFLIVLEAKEITYEFLWEGPLELVENNQITDLAVDDQDYNEMDELIIGHAHGVDIWEYSNSDYHFVKITHITKSPNHPYIHPSALYDWTDVYINPSTGGKVDEMGSHYIQKGTDIVELSNGTVLVVYCDSPRSEGLVDTRSRLMIASSANGDDPWTIYGPIIDPSFYPEGSGFGFVYERDPTIIEITPGEIWIAYVSCWYYGVVSGPYYQYQYAETISVVRWNSDGWSLPQAIVLSNYFYYSSPSLTEYYTGNYVSSPSLFTTHDSNLAGIIYVNSTVGTLTGTQKTYAKSQFASSFDTWSSGVNLPYLNETQLYSVSSVDATMTFTGYSIIFSGYQYGSTTPDADLYLLNADQSFVFDDKKGPGYVSLDYADDLNPSITELKSPTSEPALLIAYESYGSNSLGGMLATSSTDNGRTWRKPELLSTEIPFAEWYWNESTDDITLRIKDNSDYYISQRGFYAPAVTARGMSSSDEAGFYYSTNLFYRVFKDTYYNHLFMAALSPDQSVEFSDILVGANEDPFQLWLRYDLEETVALEVGDSDKDGLREILIGTSDRAVLVERGHSLLTENYEPWEGPVFYSQPWTSPIYDTKVTDVAIFDANGNLWEELIISCEEGNVYVYELNNQEAYLPNNLMMPGLVTSRNLDFAVSSVPYLVETVDLMNDGIEDLVSAWGTGIVAFYGDMNSSVTWLFDYSLIAGYFLDASEAFMEVMLADLTGDDILDIVLLSNYRQVLAIAGNNGSLLWKLNGDFMWTERVGLDIGDLDGDGELDIIVGYRTDIFIIGINGDIKNEINGLSNPVTDLKIGNFDNIATKSLAVSLSNGVAFNLTLFSAAGQKIWSNYTNKIVSNKIEAYDFGNDSLEEIVLVVAKRAIIEENSSLFLINGSNGYKLHDIPFEQGWIGKSIEILFADMNDDNVTDIIIAGTFNPISTPWKSFIGAFDGQTLEFLWSKSLPFSSLELGIRDYLTDICIGDFDQDGKEDDVGFAQNRYGLERPGSIGAYDSEGRLLFVYQADENQFAVASSSDGYLIGATTDGNLHSVAGFAFTFPSTVYPDASTRLPSALPIVVPVYDEGLWMHEKTNDLDKIVTLPDLNNDLVEEIFISNGTHYSILDGISGKAILDFEKVSGGTLVSTLVLQIDGSPALLYGTSNGYIKAIRLSENNFEMLWDANFISEDVVVADLETIRDFNGDDFIIATGGTLTKTFVALYKLGGELLDELDQTDFFNCDFPNYNATLIKGEFNKYDMDTEIALMIVDKVSHTPLMNRSYVAIIEIIADQKLDVIVQTPNPLMQGNYMQLGHDYDANGIDEIIVTSRANQITILNGEDLEIMVYRQLDAPFGMSQPDYVDLTEDGVLDIVIVVQGQGVYAIDGADLADDIWFYPDISYKPFVGVKAIPFVEKPLVAVVNFDEIFLLDSTGSLYAIDHTTHNECGSPITMLNIQSTPSGFVLVAGTHNGYVVTLDNPLVDTPYMHLSSLGVEADSMIDQPSDSLWKDKGSVLILGVIPIVALVVLLRKKK